jgi:flagellar motor switch protein FliG
LWSAIPESVWTTALKGASQQLRRTVLANLDAEGRQSLQFAIEQTSPPRLTEIDECQRRILDSAEALLTGE